MLAPTLTLIALKAIFLEGSQSLPFIPLSGRYFSELSFLRCFSSACATSHLRLIVSELASGIFGEVNKISFICRVRQLLNIMSNCVIIALRAICSSYTIYIALC